MLATYHNPKEQAMQRAATVIVFSLAAFTLTACQATPTRVHASSSQDKAMLGRIAGLAGEWQTSTTEGEADVGAVFTVSSGGSVVREVMFPGQDHEMTNMYHMDGGKLVVTHYCAAGNQPRMVATAARETDEGVVYDFEFDRVSNLRPEHDQYMGKMTLTILRDGGVRQDWQSYDRDGKLTDPFTFDLRRKPGA
jgi:hypothetical protein